jgi:CubicO group peptidase (beta-lactamase class C family)
MELDPARLANVDAVTHRYVDEGRFPCAVTAILHKGDEVHRDVYGWADVAEQVPIAEDAIFRLFSMTKPIASLALLQLYEQGSVLLEDPVGRYIPELADLTVWVGEGVDPVPAERPVTVKHLLTHTAGFTAGFQFAQPVGALYRDAGLGDLRPPMHDLAGSMAVLGGLPLTDQPGAGFHYGMSTDVVGRLVEVLSGSTLDAYLAEHVFEPLGMVDTGFWVPEDQIQRLPANYLKTPADPMFPVDTRANVKHTRPPRFLSGAGGLVGTLDDYLRFCRALRGGGELDGHRILGTKTLEYMATNHLPGGVSLNDLGQDTFSEVAMEGMGFGLGVAVVLDPAIAGANGNVGEYGWGGAASTVFWIDPVEDLVVVFLTQLVPSDAYPIRRQLRATVYGALV